MTRAERHDSPPQSFGRYRIRGVLGEGGMGRLYVAEQTGIEGFAKIVALKRILPHLADSPPFRTLFLNEARIAARLEHPNIVATYELGEVDGTYFMAMEYLPGEDLNAILARCEAPSAMPVEVAALLAQQSANGLNYAHELLDGAGTRSGLVHRDVNPSNIFVTYHGMVKLLDFGVVKAATGNNKTSPGIFKGKYAYCAPEQLQGDAIDHRTDVFSLGIVLWECLTGHRLFDNPTDAGTIDAVRSQAIVAPSLLRPEVPVELDDITMRALVRDRARRYQSAGELSDALDRFLGRRRLRPTSNSVGQWLESLFGAERAALKRAIAQGNDVEGALARMAQTESNKAAAPAPRTGASSPGSMRNLSVVRPRPLWSTSLDRGTTGAGSAAGSMGIAGPRRNPITTIEVAPTDPPPPLPSVPPPIPRPSQPRPAVAEVMSPVVVSSTAPTSAPLPARPRPNTNQKLAMLGGGVALLVVAVIAIFAMGRGKSRPAQRDTPGVATLEVQSQPPGAHVMVDGDPAGLVTPTTLRGLRVGRVVEIRLDKAGYAPVTKKIEIKAAGSLHELIKLAESNGTVHLEGLPPEASVYVDDTLAESGRTLLLTRGRHQIRVEAAQDVVYSDIIEVRAGEQTLRIPRR